MLSAVTDVWLNKMFFFLYLYRTPTYRTLLSSFYYHEKSQEVWLNLKTSAATENMPNDIKSFKLAVI